jgi:uncharacterized protein YbjT (DUF2867 family)
MDELIAVTGATGTIGRHVVQQLLDAGQRVRAVVRDPASANFDSAVEVAYADLAEPHTLDAVFAGATKAFVLANGPTIDVLEANAFDAAHRAGAGHIVKLSALEAFAPHMVGDPHAEMHQRSEAHLKNLGVAWTMLRPSFFASNLQAVFLRRTATGAAVYLPTGDGREAPIDPADIAAAAVTVLTAGGHQGKIYELTGPELLTLPEMTRKLSAVTGVPVEHVNLTDAQVRERFRADGYPPEFSDFVLRHAAGVRAGAVHLTSGVTELLGRPAATFDDYLRRNSLALKASVQELVS